MALAVRAVAVGAVARRLADPAPLAVDDEVDAAVRPGRGGRHDPR
jgi:hypothetical protein